MVATDGEADGLSNGSFWEETLPPGRDEPSFFGSTRFDAVVIGGGYSGLSAALRLAREGVSVCVLEAQRPGWGASGRNGGFCCMGGSKRSEQNLIARYGLDEASAFVNFELEAIDVVRQRIEDWHLDVDRHSDGEMILAHRPSDYGRFAAHAAFLRDTFGLQFRQVDRDELAAEGMAGPEFFGGLHNPNGFALNPMKYLRGLLEAARQAGVTLFTRSRVTRLHRDGDEWLVDLEGGEIRAPQVIIASNGYSDETMHGWLAGRLLPVLSSVMVTRPLSDAELVEQGWTSSRMAYDTRRLLHYFRLLPDGRFMFGMRGGLHETAANERAIRKLIREDFERMFPAWRDVETTHFWLGRVCMAYDLAPFIGPVPGADELYAALAFHGNGVAMASLAGERVAEVALGLRPASSLPAVVRKPLRRFPLPPLRRLYQQGAYLWYGFKDR